MEVAKLLFIGLTIYVFYAMCVCNVLISTHVPQVVKA